MKEIYCNKNWNDTQFIKKNIRTIKVLEKDELSQILKDDALHGYVHNDIWILRNKERLQGISQSAINDMINKRFKDSPVKRSPLSDLPNDVILATIKPRFVQTASEVSAWFDYIQNNYDSVAKMLNDSAAEVQTLNDSSSDDVSEK